MLCDKLLTQMVQEHQVPVEIPPPLTPAPSHVPPTPPTQNDDSMLKRMIGRMIAEDLLGNCK